MQAVHPSAGLEPAFRIHFARHATMRRPKKRRIAVPDRRSSSPQRPPKRPRRRAAGFFYKLLTVLLLVTVWPVGLFLLWKRRLRWAPATKLLASMVSMAACVVLIGFALTVNTGNERYTAAQDSINSFLDTAADDVLRIGGVIGEKAAEGCANAADFADAAWQYGSVKLSYAIDWGVEEGQQLKQIVLSWFDKAEEAPAEPDASATPEAEASASPQAAKSTPVPTAVPAADLHVGAQDESLPVYIPAAPLNPAKGRDVSNGTLARSAEFTPGALPTPKPTPEPTPEPVAFDLKPAAEAVVYYNETGTYYHTVTACGKMKSAKAHAFADLRKDEKTACNVCAAPERALLDEAYIVWIDEDGVAHLSDECASFSGKWTLASAANANENGLFGCPDCHADRYLAAIAAGETVLLNDNEAPAAGADEADADAEAADQAESIE